MKTLSTLLIATVIISSSLFAQPHEKKAVEILNKVSEQIKTAPSIKAEFTYKMKNKEMDIDEKKDGTVLLKGKKYRLNISGQTVICDGTTIWTLIEDAEEVHINTVDPDNEDAIDPQKILTTYHENHRSKLIKEGTENGIAAYFIDLVPKEGKSYFKIRMVIDKEKLQILRSTRFDKEGTQFTYIINKFIANKTVADSMFKFEKSKHPSFEVIDMR